MHRLHRVSQSAWNRPWPVFYWTPHPFCSSRRFENSESAANAFRSAIQETVAAWASVYDVVIEELSGGLDSAILLSALCRSQDASNVVCVNHVSPGCDGDERPYARKAAAFWGCDLVEQTLNPTEIDLLESVDIPTIARPSYHVLTYGMDKAIGSLAREQGANVIMSGRGGDQLFYKSNSLMTVADYFWRRGGLWRPIRTAKNRALVVRSTIPTILAKAVRYGILRQSYDPYSDLFQYAPFLNEGALRSIDIDEFKHPWLRSDCRLSPGKVNHVLWVVDSQNFNFEPLG